ncbi:MAG: proline dehydrogenase [Polyangiaceae bacterium]|nr:proline dehydrogenase [Polyangiaceae bacterium]
MSGAGRVEARRARVLRAVAIAGRIADPGDPLGSEARARLYEVTGLSREGIDLALSAHLETNPSDEDVDALLASGEGEGAERCYVVIAANVCTSALRAIAVALSAAPSVVVRPSSRDPVLAEILARELAADEAFRAAGGSIEVSREIHPAAGDELHVYGSDSTVEALRAANPGVLVRGHGTGLGVAVVGEAIDIREAARAVSRDVVPFDQRGCLSPRMVLVEGGEDRALEFGRALDEALCALSIAVPRGELDAGVLGEIAAYRATIESIGRYWPGEHHAVGVDPAPRALLLPPAARVVHVAPVSAGTAAALIGPWARYITVVGADDDGRVVRAIRACVPNGRYSRLGAMQRPPLDGPVDRRPK